MGALFVFASEPLESANLPTPFYRICLQYRQAGDSELTSRRVKCSEDLQRASGRN